MNKVDKIFVAGHTGLIGSAVTQRLQSQGFTNLLLPSHDDLELTDAVAVDSFFQVNSPKYVVLAAGKVGGIIENKTYPADFMDENLAIQINVLKAARKVGVTKLILFGSSCMYPRESAQPMAEDILLTGRPEPTSLPYAISKLAGTYMCLAYNKQYGDKRFIPVIPNSVYGPNDNFNPISGHVLSALMARFHEAKASGADAITIWGSGFPRREFVHADDVADACLYLLLKDVSALEFPVNIGFGSDMSIQELAARIANVVGYKGNLEWDLTKPDGTPHKLLDSSRLQAFGWQPKVIFTEGLSSTYEWYLRNKQNSSALD